jgi:O-antigen biosynthesis protein
LTIPRSRAELGIKVANRLARSSLFGLRPALDDLRLSRSISEKLSLVEALDFDDDDLAANRAQLEAARLLKTPIRSINWYLPNFHYAFYGGVFTILRFAAGLLESYGVQSNLIIYDTPSVSAAEMKKRVTDAFPGLAGVPLIVLKGASDAVPDSDASVATFWTSAFVLLRERKARRKFYFVQDYEPLFYPAGSLHGLAEATYRFGFPGIVNTTGLCEVYRRESGALAVAFTPSIDKTIFHPPVQERPRTPFRIFFYGRPETDRNAFEIGLSALRKVKQRNGEGVQIVVAGSKFPRGLTAQAPGIEFRGLLPYRETGELYRSCHAGLALMLTRHPSYLPFELMGCGAVPVVNVNAANRWLLRHGENACMVEPSPSCLAAAFESLIKDPALLGRLSAEARQTVAATTWESEVARVFRFMNNEAKVGEG